MREVKSPGMGPGMGMAPPYSPLGTPLSALQGLSHRTSETNLRRCGGAASRASQKSSLLYDLYDGRDIGPQRSVSLTTLSPSAAVPVNMVTSPASPGSVCTNGDPDLEPRMAQLETLEAKMASIEVSLSTTPRRKKNGSIGSAAGVTAAAQTNGGNGVNGVAANNSPYRPSLSLSLQQRPPPSEKERRAAEERLSKLRLDVDNKRLAIKNLKMALERLDITDNIDVRIQQAELEYQLGREELNLLSLLEETRNVAAMLEEAERARSSQAANTLYCCVGSSGRAVVVSVQVQYDPKSPQFGAGPRDDAPGLYVHWATDTSGMAKGDRVLEVNGKQVLCKTRDDMHRLLAVSPDPAQLVVLRAAPEQDLTALSAQLAAERERALQAERTADSLRADGVRLSHRISYLEDQVSELLSSSAAHGSTAGPDVQLYQKGSQVQLVSNLPRLEASLRSKRLERDRDREDPQRLERLDRLEQRLERAKRQSHSSSNLTLSPSPHTPLARSTNALDVFSAESPRGPVQHIRIRQSPSQPDGLASDSDIRRPRRKSEAPASHSSHGDGLSSGRHYRKHHEYCSSGGEGGNTRPASSSSTTRPVPPRKPLRLSLHRAASLQSVESAPPGTAAASALTPGDKKAPKRNHKGEAPVPPGAGPGAQPALPSDAPHPHPFQSALRWTSSSPSQHSQHHVYRSSGNLTANGATIGGEKWC
ncbi:uncharacterized protein LOC117651961 [Thrips palmi]|uniref:Uncharacterized protein LOC117651961 n=1 Tax=Thrips palmi TaxID=161013 RepID=A0A6P9A5G9_THRPL|nr:uncharacterized protein LOC117651961 [Thrips palmi]